MAGGGRVVYFYPRAPRRTRRDGRAATPGYPQATGTRRALHAQTCLKKGLRQIRLGRCTSIRAFPAPTCPRASSTCPSTRRSRHGGNTAVVRACGSLWPTDRCRRAGAVRKLARFVRSGWSGALRSAIGGWPGLPGHVVPGPAAGLEGHCHWLSLAGLPPRGKGGGFDLVAWTTT